VAGFPAPKPIGILLFSSLAVWTGARLPRDLRTGDVFTVGIAA
jgi:hypothetical protein